MAFNLSRKHVLKGLGLFLYFWLAVLAPTEKPRTQIRTIFLDSVASTTKKVFCNYINDGLYYRYMLMLCKKVSINNNKINKPYNKAYYCILSQTGHRTNRAMFHIPIMNLLDTIMNGQYFD